MGIGKLGFASNVMLYGDDGRTVYTVTEVGYLELGRNIKVAMMPGEVAPELVKGGKTLTAEGSASGEDFVYGPMKSYFDNGITVSSHSDFPALGGSPDDPFGIMEIAVTGMLSGEKDCAPWWPEECPAREQAIMALTINIAKQMFIENERGSIKTGKYADFLLVDKDVLSCPETEIHEAKPSATYFEGKKVYSR